jgi:hypothetical protein
MAGILKIAVQAKSLKSMGSKKINIIPPKKLPL